MYVYMYICLSSQLYPFFVGGPETADAAPTVRILMPLAPGILGLKSICVHTYVFYLSLICLDIYIYIYKQLPQAPTNLGVSKNFGGSCVQVLI